MEGTEDQTDTVKKVLTKTKPSVQKLTLSNKGRNTGFCTEQQMLLKNYLNFYAILSLILIVSFHRSSECSS
jgi:hypothetical protein